MAIPILNWMLECTGCGSRRVVQDTYLKPLPDAPGRERNPFGNYGGPPLEKRYRCTKGCSSALRPIGSIFDSDDTEMWLFRPHVRVEMTVEQRREWRALILEAGITDLAPSTSRREP
jgi:hypothetical protein